MPKIKRDEIGLYVRVDGWICRPFAETLIKEGEDVKGSHPPGDTARVTSRESGEVEFWAITVAHWWHAVEGKGQRSVDLREADRRRLLSYYEDESDWKVHEKRVMNDISFGSGQRAEMMTNNHRKYRRTA